MKSSHPSRNDGPSKNISPKVSARQVNDLDAWELALYTYHNHAEIYGSHTLTFAIENMLITHHYNRELGKAFPSNETLRKHFGLSASMMSRHMARIAQARDADGNLLWKIIPGYSVGLSSKSNEYIPLFRQKVLEWERPKSEPPKREFLYADHELAPAQQGNVDDLDPSFGFNGDSADVQDSFDEVQDVVHNAFGSDEVEPNETSEDSFDEGASTDFSHEDASDIILPDTVYPDMESMKDFVRHMFNEMRAGVPSSHGLGINHRTAPVTKSTKFARLPQADKDFLNAFVSYLSHLSHVDQETFNDLATALVRRWDEAKKPNAVFYLEYMDDYLAANPQSE